MENEEKSEIFRQSVQLDMYVSDSHTVFSFSQTQQPDSVSEPESVW